MPRFGVHGGIEIAVVFLNLNWGAGDFADGKARHSWCNLQWVVGEITKISQLRGIITKDVPLCTNVRRVLNVSVDENNIIWERPNICFH